MGFVKLELVPRGVGRLLVRVPRLFYSIEESEIAEVTIELINDGTRRLDNVEVTAEPPYLWDKQIEPRLIKAMVGREPRWPSHRTRLSPRRKSRMPDSRSPNRRKLNRPRGNSRAFNRRPRCCFCQALKRVRPKS